MAVLVVDERHRHLGPAQHLERVEGVERIGHEPAPGETRAGCRGARRAAAPARSSRTATTPSMLSGYPRRPAGGNACVVTRMRPGFVRRRRSRSIQSTSVRGVMTPRTARSPRRSTPAIMRCARPSRSRPQSPPRRRWSSSPPRSRRLRIGGSAEERNNSLVEASSSQTTGAADPRHHRHQGRDGAGDRLRHSAARGASARVRR